MAQLIVDEVSHSYPAPDGQLRPILDRVSLQIASGEFISIIGASGSGKTTLLRIIANLIKPQLGRIKIDGEQATRPGGRISFVFQQDALWPWRSVLANATYGLEVRNVPRAEAAERARHFLKLVGLAAYENYYPHQLSGGMRQRVNLARALTVDPDILLMDEPFAALDAQTREVMQLELARIWQETKKTIVFVTHQIDEAVFLGDRVVTLSSRPGAVRAVTEIAIERPRDMRVKRSEAFQSYVGALWDLIETDVLKDFRSGVGGIP